ncbi:MAG: hypothetical protein PHQ75_05700 [Thermoguttaceae bacterium]|nr:hypothetical protein [Thermoguttaceae bacterium]
MNSSRLFIPESIVFYFLAFLVSVAILTAGLIGYYQLPALEAMFGPGTFSALDLGRPINILTWLFSVLWIVMVLQAFMIIALTHENRLGLFQQLFWINVAVICLVMSANSICSFSPMLKNAFEGSLDKTGVSESARLIVYRFMYVGVAFFLFIELSLLLSYIRKQCKSRMLLHSSFMFCLLVLGITFFCCWQIPNEAASPESVLPSAPGTSEPDHTDRKPSRARGLIASHSEKNRVKTLKTEEGKPRVVAQNDASGSFRYASQEDDHISNKTDVSDKMVVRTSQFTTVADESMVSETSDESTRNIADDHTTDDRDTDETAVTAVVRPEKNADMSDEKTSSANSDSAKEPQTMKRWEDLFGWQNSLEEQWGFKGQFEEMLGLSGSIEALVLGADVSLDLVRIRRIIRYGLFGFSLITLCIAFGLVARGGKLEINRRYRQQFERFYGINEGYRLATKNSF